MDISLEVLEALDITIDTLVDRIMKQFNSWGLVLANGIVIRGVTKGASV